MELEYRHLCLMPPELGYMPPRVTVGPEHEGLYSSRPRPMVPLNIVGPEGEVFEWAVIDTGSDGTSLPPRLMAPLGITPGMCEPEPAALDGAITPCPKFTEGVELTVAGTWRLRVEPHFIPAFQFVLLGEDDFLEAFRVTLDRRGRTLMLHAYADVEQLEPATPARVAA